MQKKTRSRRHTTPDRVFHKITKRSQRRRYQVLTIRRFARRAFAFAGRLPWFAFLRVLPGLDIFESPLLTKPSAFLPWTISRKESALARKTREPTIHISLTNAFPRSFFRSPNRRFRLSVVESAQFVSEIIPAPSSLKRGASQKNTTSFSLLPTTTNAWGAPIP